MSFSPFDLYRFDEFELSRSRRTLLRKGEPVALLPKTFEVLAWLVENPGRVLAKEEIVRAVWRESFVEENNLTQHISLLRKALADRARCIATIPGRGYQFTAEVFAAEMGAGQPGSAGGSAHPGRNGAGAHSGNGSRRHAEPAAEPEPSSFSTEEPGRRPQARIPSFSVFLAHMLRRGAR
jgi:DNA-binding winged helix-turn-helix (wHTH) protein